MSQTLKHDFQKMQTFFEDENKKLNDFAKRLLDQNSSMKQEVQAKDILIDKLQTNLAQKESESMNLQQKFTNLKQSHSRSNANAESRVGNSSVNKDGYHISAEDEI